VRGAAAQTGALEGGTANKRLMSGLKLLETVLPLDEAVIFQPDENGALAPAARLRANGNAALETGRHNAWREGVGLCEQAVATGQLVRTTATQQQSGDADQMKDARSALCWCACVKVLTKKIAR